MTQAGGSTHDFSGGIDSFSDSSSIVTGYFSGAAMFGEFQLTAQGASDVYVAKLDALGNFLWAQQAGGTEADQGSKLITHSDGSATIVGNFKETADFGNYKLTSSGDGDVDGLVAVIDPDENWVSALSTGESAYHDLSSDSPSSSAPVFQSATTSTDGSKIILSYDQQLSTETISTLHFAVHVNGSLVDNIVSSVAVVDGTNFGTNVELTLNTLIGLGDEVTLYYTDPDAMSDDTNVI